MNEELSISKKLKNTKIKDIKMASDPLYKKYEIFNLIEFLENNKDVIKKIKKIKYFLNKELKFCLNLFPVLIKFLTVLYPFFPK